MYYADYHSHSILSMDGRVPLAVMAHHALQAGMRELCITDHFDLLDGDANRCYAADHNWPAALEQFQSTRERFKGKLTLKLGLEYGMGHIDPLQSDLVLHQSQLDFVIGSVHNLSPQQGGTDLFFLDFTTAANCHRALEDYFSSLERLVQTEYYDSLGHILYPLRYMNGLATIHPYLERVRGLLQHVIARGKAMEVNTYRGRTIEEWRPLLEVYKALGGELVTVGSDAHDPVHAGAGIPQAYELLQAIGFPYVTTYEKRRPVPIKL